MRKIEWKMGIGYGNAVRRGTIEVDDDATEDQIDEQVWEDAVQWVDTSWDEVE